jgi:hypothetical protein
MRILNSSSTTAAEEAFASQRWVVVCTPQGATTPRAIDNVKKAEACPILGLCVGNNTCNTMVYSNVGHFYFDWNAEGNQYFDEITSDSD